MQLASAATPRSGLSGGIAVEYTTSAPAGTFVARVPDHRLDPVLRRRRAV